MNIIVAYVMTKEKLSKEIAEKVAELYMGGMGYEEALEKARKIYNIDEVAKKGD